MRDYDIYYKRMFGNIDEKTDWVISELEKGRIKSVVDFGCANGKTTEFLASLFPKTNFIGVEKEVFVKQLKKENIFKNIRYESNLKNVPFRGSLLFLSSVLHELFTFEKKPWELFDYFFESDVIIIRDMFYGYKEQNSFFSKEASNDLERQFLESLKKEQFTDKDFAHFLLKVEYLENWNSELEENYFATPFDEIIKKAFLNNFVIEDDVKYTNAFIKERIKKKHRENYSKYAEYTHRKIKFRKVNNK